jgi:Ca2+-binding EF-hand superfamily protein
MKLSKIAFCAALAAAFSLPFTAEAAKGDKRKKGAAPAFSSIDKNGDGTITQEEYVAAMKDSIGEETAKTQFGSLDKNKDDKLSSEEYSAAAAGKKEKKKKNKE